MGILDDLVFDYFDAPRLTGRRGRKLLEQGVRADPALATRWGALAAARRGGAEGRRLSARAALRADFARLCTNSAQTAQFRESRA